jgi:hypothetical protein
MYETSFHTLSERYFKASPWPTEKAIAPIVDGDHVFCLLYKEMWYRHLYARTSPTLEQRCESWDNYCALFGVILHGNVNMQLPNIWLSDMVDEFIYQFQSFCQYRGKLSTKTPEELELLKRCDQVTNPSAQQRSHPSAASGAQGDLPPSETQMPTHTAQTRRERARRVAPARLDWVERLADVRRCRGCRCGTCWASSTTFRRSSISLAS